ncbi:related to salicylate 1-monooxygenase [Phialocephala subalpina]|uniref:Related to salicylate 1-monooxygenase n=1 Tax=Phialocephala subalpina TaxID=576137 RepID=A0A1L7XW81_9HELO|nr:related to salicylate 1-monooxygenase [Phialocephala subalpina]
MSSASKEPISIAIIGAGIAGITLAIALSRHNPSLQLTIYESRPGFSEIGAGVGFGPNATQAMRLISPDLAAAHSRVATPNASPEKGHIWFDFRHGTGPDAGELIAEIETKGGFVHCGCSRAQFLDEIVALIPGNVKTKFGMKVVDVIEDEESGKMKVKFLDGTEIEADAVVGCDGIRSACRKILLGAGDERANAVYSGKYAYRKVVDMEKAVEVAGDLVENRQVFVGHGGHLLMFPIRGGRGLNIVAFVDAKGKPWTDRQWVVPATREDVLEDYKGWGKIPTALLELIDEPDKWALFDHLPAPTYTIGKFCLVGDAAHATTPHSGSGAGFCVEDAHLLSGLLTPDIIKSPSDIKYSFQAYDAIRRPRSQKLVANSRQNGRTLELQTDDGGVLNSKDLAGRMEVNMGWAWEVDLSAMLREAKDLVKRNKGTNGVK